MPGGLFATGSPFATRLLSGKSGEGRGRAGEGLKKGQGEPYAHTRHFNLGCGMVLPGGLFATGGTSATRLLSQKDARKRTRDARQDKRGQKLPGHVQRSKKTKAANSKRPPSPAPPNEARQSTKTKAPPPPRPVSFRNNGTSASSARKRPTEPHEAQGKHMETGREKTLTRAGRKHPRQNHLRKGSVGRKGGARQNPSSKGVFLGQNNAKKAPKRRRRLQSKLPCPSYRETLNRYGTEMRCIRINVWLFKDKCRINVG